MNQNERTTAWAKFSPRQQMMFQASWGALGYENERPAKPKRQRPNYNLPVAILVLFIACVVAILSSVAGVLFPPHYSVRPTINVPSAALTQSQQDYIRHLARAHWTAPVEGEEASSVTGAMILAFERLGDGAVAIAHADARIRRPDDEEYVPNLDLARFAAPAGSKEKELLERAAFLAGQRRGLW
jgi:hypothetical protein